MNTEFTQSRRTFAKTAVAATLGSSLFTAQPAAATENKIEYVEAQPDEGFHHGFYVSWPMNPSIQDQNRAPPINLVAGLPEQDPTADGTRDHSKSETKHEAMLQAKKGGEFYQGVKSHLPTISPNIQPPSYNEFDGYMPVLSRGTLEIDNDRYKRLDLQLLSMVEYVKQQVNENKKVVSDSGLIASGYSANGAFANRLALLHPDEVEAVLSGGNAILTVPTDEWNGTKMPYPLGTWGLNQVIDKEIDIKAYKNTPKFFMFNEYDETNLLRWDNFYQGLNQFATDIYPRKSVSEQWRKTQEIHQKLSNNTIFRMYSTFGHNMPSQHIEKISKEMSRFLYEKDVINEIQDPNNSVVNNVLEFIMSILKKTLK